MSGRLHAERTRGWRCLIALIAFPLLAMLPDIDVLWVALGVPDTGAAGHRGATHSPLFALVVGAVALAFGRGAWRRRLRLGVTVALVVASHGVLDALAQDGRGILFLWPLSEERFHFPWRPLPDAPTGLAFFSRLGFDSLAIELVYFLPLVAYALWPRRARRPALRTIAALPPVRFGARGSLPPRRIRSAP